MIITRTPFRVSFVGGGSDIPEFYRAHGGAVVSTTINKYIYICLNKKFDDKVRVSYSITEEVKNSSSVKHPLVNAALRKLNLNNGLEITSIADIPSLGSGLGSSSAFAVGLLNAAHTFMNENVLARQLAEEACEVEIGMCGEPIGKQDQYAAAFGGLNFIQFNQDETVNLHPIRLKPAVLERWSENILLFFTNRTRSASALLKHQNEDVKRNRTKLDTLKKMTQFAEDLKRDLESGNISSFGEILHDNWLLKKSLSYGISDSEIDRWYNRARDAGAKGGKILGAGGGGFLLMYVEPEDQQAVTEALKDLKRVDARFEPKGSQVVLNI